MPRMRFVIQVRVDSRGDCKALSSKRADYPDCYSSDMNPIISGIRAIRGFKVRLPVLHCNSQPNSLSPPSLFHSDSEADSLSPPSLFHSDSEADSLSPPSLFHSDSEADHIIDDAFKYRVAVFVGRKTDGAMEFRIGITNLDRGLGALFDRGHLGEIDQFFIADTEPHIVIFGLGPAGFERDMRVLFEF